MKPPAVVIGDGNWRRGCGIGTERKAGAAGCFVSEVVDINIKRRIVVGYNDMFTALAIARGFRGGRGVYEDRELYIKDFDRSHIDAVGAFPETFYKYLSAALVPEVVGVSPAAVGAEVTLPAVFEKRWDLVADSAFEKTAFVPSCSEGLRVDILGILDDGRLLIGEVKNMEGVGGPVGLKLGDVAERAKVLGALLRDNSALLSALVYNGGRLPGGEGLKLLYGEPSVDISSEEDLRSRRGEVCRCRGRREKGRGVCVRRLAGPATG